MISELLDAAQGFASSSVAGLLRTAPDLEPLVGYIDSLYHSPESGKLTPSLHRPQAYKTEKTIEILPNDGADAECDKRSAEVQELEAALDSLLRKARKDIKYV
jgi:DNA mismatch repair protein MSH6